MRLSIRTKFNLFIIPIALLLIATLFFAITSYQKIPTQTILIALALVMLMGILAPWLFLRNMINAIIQLKTAAAKISSGKLDTLIEVESEDEIGDLANGLVKITANLQALTVSHHYVDSLIASMMDTLIVIAPDGTIQMVNNATCNLLGYKESELLNQPFGIIMVEEAFRGIILAEILAKGSLMGYQGTYRTKSGTPIPVFLSGSVICDDSGKPTGMVCIGRDMREINRLIEKEKELATSAAIGTLAAGMSHEINNALAGVLGTAELIQLGLVEKDDIKLVIQETMRAANIMRDLLTYVQAETGSLVPVSVPNLIAKSLKMVAHNLKAHDIFVDFTPPADNLPVINANPSQLHRVWLNVLTNAIDFTPNGGLIKIDTLFDDHFVQVNIADSGTGIPAQVLPQIFNPFFTTKNRAEGTGLSLSVASSIVKAHGGSIEASNRADGGALFVVRLPIQASPFAAYAN